MEPVETIMIRAQQNFELYDQINSMQITIDGDSMVNILKEHENVYYKFISMGILFPALVKNDTEQIFVMCRELNDAKPALINGKLVNLLAAINLNKINDWEHIKGKSLWVNVNFDNLQEAKKIDYFCFSFKTASLNDLLLFIIYLIDDFNNAITFNNGEKKISISNFKNHVFKMNKKLRPIKFTIQARDEQVARILEELERDIEKFKILIQNTY